MTRYIRDLVPRPPRGDYFPALGALISSTRTVIAHLDAGVAPHPGLDWPDGAPPPNLLIGRGRNFFDPGPPNGDAPITPLRRSAQVAADLLEYPDHGVKTLSALVGPNAQTLRGVVPGAKVIPYRVANGPLFRKGAGPAMPATAGAALGRAVAHAAAQADVRVMSISMGNPGFLGVFEPLRALIGGEQGLPRETGAAFDAAYDAGIVVVCAAGQVIDQVVYPARYARTIAVAGFDKPAATYHHYPRDGYDSSERVDVWAKAMRINRASYLIDEDPPRPIFADDHDNPEDEPSGTSYACPQVAGAAALWVERHHDALETLFAAERWKITEAFRAALRGSARVEQARLRNRVFVPIRVLDIPRLLATPPAPFDGDKPGASADAGFF